MSLAPFAYRDGVLHAEEASLAEIAAAVGTPVYCYAAGAMAARYDAFAAALAGQRALVAYAVKANANLAVIAALARRGAGADVVSEGELHRALMAGVPGERIVFSGVGKTAREMAAGLDAGILQFNVESEPELELLARVAAERGETAPVALRINPDVDARTHAKIATGAAETKFGIPWVHAAALYARAAELPGIAPVGLAVHIGSQLTDLAPFAAAFTRLAALVRELRASGHRVERLDLGGGLGITYGDGGPAPPAPRDYADMVARLVGDLGCRLIFEPGRWLVGEAGALLARVLYVKQGAAHDFVVLDAAMNDLMRPALYGAHHPIVPVRAPAPDAQHQPVDVVGPICETGDCFATARPLPPLAAGDLVAILACGAYGAAMASTYNTRPLVPEVLVHGREWDLVRARPSYTEMLGQDILPSWLGMTPP